MTTITPAPVAAHAPITATAAKAGSDPNELVGSGKTHARWLGGLVGGGLGIGAAMGISKLTAGSSAMPIKVIGGLASAAAIGGGAFGGQYLLGQATRSTRAEADRALRAQQQDLGIEVRVLQAKAGGQLSRDDEQQVTELRSERRGLVASAREGNALGKWVMPLLGAAAVGTAAAMVAYKMSPDDGKGLTALFNGMFGAGGGAVAGGWAGFTAGEILTRGEPQATIPADAQARIDAIDAELDAILGEQVVTV